MTRPPWVGRASPRAPSDDDFQRAAAQIGCEVSAIRAVWDVESAGRPFRDDGSVERRFEPHLMPRASWDSLGFVPAGGQAPWRASLEIPQARRDAMFGVAWRRDPAAALAATSWGGPQILGRWFADLGYPSAEAMVRDFASGAGTQVAAFARLVDAWGVGTALRAQDWTAFAARYNGTRQVAVYAARVEAAHRRLTGRPSAIVLRAGDRGPAVAALQRALGVPDDGAFGPGTVRAVEDFQRAHGLTPDGVVGHLTWKALGIAAPEVAASAPTQPSTAESRVDRVAQLAAVSAPLAAGASVLGPLREAVPPTLWQIGWWVAAGLALLAVAPWVIRRLRGIWR